MFIIILNFGFFLLKLTVFSCHASCHECRCHVAVACAGKNTVFGRPFV